MSNKGEELFNIVRSKIQKLKEEGTLEKKFGDFWKLGCIAKYRAFDLRYLYDDTGREFVDKYRDTMTKMRDFCINHLDELVQKTIKVMEKTNHFKVYYAKTNEEAQKIFMDELGNNKVIYKSKSMEAKDIGIIDVLKENNIEIKETDLGDVLCQMFDYKLPIYQLGPGVHFTEQEIVDKIKEKYGIELEPKAEAVVQWLRKTYRRELLNDVRISLTSANAISAEDGTIVLGENEGNISLLTRATDKHIVVVGITKIVPTLIDALLVTKIQERINYVSMAYISLISGPSNTSDIQGTSVEGMYGAKEVVIIFVDDWRTKAIKEDLFYKDFLKCISCKSCNFVCTASRAFGNVYATKYGLGAPCIIRSYIHQGLEDAVKGGLFLCTNCKNCFNWCPVGVDLGEILKNMKKEAMDKGLAPPPLKAYKEKIIKEKNPFK
ncbi:MAG: LUD domain-containing protein [Promethearchaeota archaeon]